MFTTTGPPRAMFLTLLSMLFVLNVGCLSQELLKNPDFEQPFGEDDWYSYCGSFEQDTDAYTGTYSGKLSQRYAHLELNR